MDPEIIIIGGGLAGSEAAWQLARRGHCVKLFEMRPHVKTGAHLTHTLAELVCSNSLGSSLINRPSGLLQNELSLLDSKLVECAHHTALPAGSALAVDRIEFSKLVQSTISSHPNIEVINEEVTNLPPGFVIIASGPLTSPRFATHLAQKFGKPNLFFYDALAPIISAETVDMTIAFKGSRYNRGQDAEGDYINCPFTKEQYQTFVHALLLADKVNQKLIRGDEKTFITNNSYQYFEGCLPIEVLAEREENALAYGPMRPIGLSHSKTGIPPYAVVQLRQDNLAGSLYNMVGFQTNLTYKAQAHVFRLIPGLETAEFIRFGQMHRNTFINSPKLVLPTLQLKFDQAKFIAGQLAGLEGYLGSVASGLVAGINLSRILEGAQPLVYPPSTMIGGLLWYITHADQFTFQPMKANFGLLPSLPNRIKDKLARNSQLADRSIEILGNFIDENNINK